MFRLMILGIEETERFLNSNAHDVSGVISISDSYDSLNVSAVDKWAQRQTKKPLELYFLDYEDGSDLGPTRDQVELGIEYGRQIKEDELFLIHCHQGRSRSAGMAAVILCDYLQKHQPEFAEHIAQKAMTEVLRIRSIAVPNMEVLRLGDEILGLGGHLLDLGRQVNGYANKKENNKYKGWGGMY